MSKPNPAASTPEPQPTVEPTPVEPTEPTEPTTEPTDTDIEARIQAALAAERQRVAAIQARCTEVGKPELAAPLIAAGASLAACNAAIVDAWMQQGGPEIINALPVSVGGEFETLVAAEVAAGKTRAQAIRTVARSHPDQHQAYIARLNGRAA
ncbi:MAG: hypothetical protein MZU84_03140 [Sphingobacterium sp.]|nr:hypothetical protein [Sphingobacterium sp.]